jgi:hypothetical protein
VPAGPRLPTGDPYDTHRLLQPLADAQDRAARLEASAAAASPAVTAGLRARVAYREAAGWLAHTHTWVHACDLALRDAGVTGSYAAAALAGRLAAELPTMTALDTRPDTVPADQMAGSALCLARLWRPARRTSHLAAGRQCRGRAGNPRLAGLVRHDR